MRTQRLETGAYKSKKLATRPARRVFRPTAPRAAQDRSLRLTRTGGCRTTESPFAVTVFFVRGLPTEPFWFLLLDERFGTKPEIIALVAAFDDVSKID
jgi:hypothetical protein